VNQEKMEQSAADYQKTAFDGYRPEKDPPFSPKHRENRFQTTIIVPKVVGESDFMGLSL